MPSRPTEHQSTDFDRNDIEFSRSQTGDAEDGSLETFLRDVDMSSIVAEEDNVEGVLAALDDDDVASEIDGSVRPTAASNLPDCKNDAGNVK